jgi:LCP family protein required for cell wall assembly
MEGKAKRKQVSWRRLSTVLAILIMSFSTGYTAMAYFLTGEANIPGVKSSNALTYQPGERVNILLLGTDARPGEKDARTDSIIVASIQPYEKKAALVSIPRDTLVEIPGHGKDKINSANVVGGPNMTKEIVENLLDLKVDHYVKTNFEGFRDIIETLGGVTIDVEKNMRYYDPTDGTNINLKKGVQQLTGKKALDYARFRHDSLGDISRTQRQQKLLKAVVSEALQAKTVLKLPALIPQIAKAIETDLSLAEMLKLAAMGRDLENLQIVSQTLPGQFYNNQGSYWKADEVKAKLVLNDMLNGVQTEVVIGPDINVTKKAARTAKAELKKKVSPEISEQSKLPEAPKPVPENINPDGANTGANDGASATDGTIDNSAQQGNPVTPGQSSGEAKPTNPAGSIQTNGGTPNLSSQPGNIEAGAQPGTTEAGSQPGGA